MDVKCDDTPVFDRGFFLQIDDDIVVDMDVMKELDIPRESQKALDDNAVVAACVDGGGCLADEFRNDRAVENAFWIQKTVVRADMRRGAAVWLEFQNGIDHGHRRLVWQKLCGWDRGVIHGVYRKS